MLQQHVDSGADVTVATIEVDPAGSRRPLRRHRDRQRTGASSASRKSPLDPKRSRCTPDKVNASMGVYIFNTQLLIPDSDRRRRRPQFHARFRPRHPAAHSLASIASSPTTSWTKTATARTTGATSARSTPTTKPTWTWSRFRRFSISTTRPGRCAPGSTSIRPAKFVFADPDRMGVAARFHRGRRLDHFRRAREALRAGLRRAHQQLLRSGKFDPLSTT